MSELIFGIPAQYIALAIMGMVYAVIIAEKMNQAVIALVASSLAVILGLLNQEQAIEAIDFNTLFLLIGMMVIVGIMKETGIFQYVAIVAAKSVRASPRGLLAVLSLITAVFSAFLDNVTTVMLIVPIVILLTEQLKLKPFPFLLAQIIFSNVGGTATLIGDPPNILIGSAVGLSFMDFMVNMGPVIIVEIIVMLAVFDFFWGRHLTTSMRARAHLLRYEPNKALKNHSLLIKSFIVLGLVMAGFTVGHNFLHIETGTTALAGAALLMFLDGFGHNLSEKNKKVHEAFHEVEWDTIFFFLGLFVVVASLEHTGLLALAAGKITDFTDGDFTKTGMAILWVSTFFSAFVNNIPFVATLIPVIESMGDTFGHGEALNPLWWSLVLGACLGGNGTLIGASANVMVASFADRAGHPINFMRYLALGLPLTLLTIVIANIYLLLVYFM
ncbi:MAG: ArsB/NhaD family transporter [Pseudobdellovibrionaceae bacterium]|jgi:Na+/H+ antiporter NhaD/arsenite permease-like protein|nr:ArsB/NhaD family transporter [Pseudobdellovibrionaceae bacterium]